MAALCLAAAAPSIAKDRADDQTSPLVKSLIACRDLADAAARLDCFDRATGSIAAALQSKSVVMVDRAQIDRNRRAEFGARRPPRDLPAPADVDAGTLSSIEGSVVGATQGSDGGWIVALKDGSVWRQTDDTPLGTPPRAGDKVIVSRAALGSFKMKVGKRPGMRVRRLS